MTALLLARSQLRLARSNWAATVTVLLAIALAVTSVVTVHLTSVAVARAISDTGAFAGYSHVVTRPGLTEADYFDLRLRWRRGEWPQVAGMFPMVDGTIETGDVHYRVLGLDPVADFQPSATGQMPIPGGTALAGATLSRYLVDDVVIAGNDAARHLGQHGGLPEGVRLAVVGDGEMLHADLPTAWRILDRPGELDAIWLRTGAATGGRLRDGAMTALGALLPGFAAALEPPPGPDIDGYTVTPAANWQPVGRYADALVFNLGALGALALLVAGFLVAQVVFANVAARRREIGRLLDIGVPRGRLAGLQIVESACWGALGAAAGLGAGRYLAGVLSAPVLTDTSGPELDAWVVGKALGAGVIVAVAGAAWAVRNIRRVGEAVAGDRSRWLGAAVGVAAVAAAALLLGLDDLAAAFAALLALCVTHMLLVVPAVSWLARRGANLAKGLASHLNLRAGALHAREIRLALGALSIATAAAMGMGLMVESLRLDFLAMLDARLQPGVYLSDAGEVDEGWLAAQPGVRALRRPAEMRARVEQGAVAVTFADTDAEETARYGLSGPLADAVMLNEQGARRFDLTTGDTVTLDAGSGSVAVPIAHVFRDFGAPMPRLIVPMELAARFEGVPMRRDRVFVATTPDAAAPVARAIGDRWPALRTQDRQQMRALAQDVFDRSFAVAAGLTAVALAVAAVGLYGALTALQARRATEFRLLHAMGYSQRGLWLAALSQCAVQGAVAVAASLPLGYTIAWVLCEFVSPAAFGWRIALHPDAGATLLPVVWGLLAALAAGIVPSWRSAFRRAVPADE